MQTAATTTATAARNPFATLARQVISKAAGRKPASKPAAKSTRKPSTKPASKPAAKSTPQAVARTVTGYGGNSIPVTAKLRAGAVPVSTVRAGSYRAALLQAVASAPTVGAALAAKLPAPYAARHVTPLDVRFALENGFAEFVDAEQVSKALAQALDQAKARAAAGRKRAAQQAF